MTEWSQRHAEEQKDNIKPQRNDLLTWLTSPNSVCQASSASAECRDAVSAVWWLVTEGVSFWGY